MSVPLDPIKILKVQLGVLGLGMDKRNNTLGLSLSNLGLVLNIWGDAFFILMSENTLVLVHSTLYIEFVS